MREAKAVQSIASESTKSSSSSLGYRPAVDGLRAVAVLAVCIFHLDRGLLPGGFVGVDIFFVISGYLITSIIVKDCERGSFSFGRFYQRRIARLLTVFVVVGTVTLAAAAFVYSNQDLASAGASLAAAAGSVANFKLLFQGSYFVLSPDSQPFLHCWSLSVEEQFYLLFPVSFVLLYRTLRPHLTKVLVGMWAMSLLFCVLLTYQRPEWAFYLLPTRAWELLSGAILSVVPCAIKTRNKFVRSSVSVWGLLLVSVSLFGISEKTAFPGYVAVAPVLGAALVLIPDQNATSLGERFLSWGPMAAVGRASYSLYLWHWPVFSLVDYQWFLSSPMVRLTLKIVMTAGATAICYIVFERPSRSFLNDPRRRRLAFGALVLSVATLVPLGIAVRRANYVDASERDVAKGGLHFNKSGNSGSMILMGDSNGAMYGKMVNEFAKERDLKLNIISVAAGDPLPHSSGAESSLWLASLGVVKRERPNLLVLVCNWNKLANDKGRLELALAQLSPFVEQIILLTQPPQLPASATREGMRNGSRPPFFEDESERQSRLKENEFVKTFRGGKVWIVDVEPLFSKGNGEVTGIDAHGLQLYQDRDHLSDVAAHLVKNELAHVIARK